jgi:hypothetical protein
LHLLFDLIVGILSELSLGGLMPLIVEFKLIKRLLNDTAAKIDQESNETNNRNEQSNNLPVELVSSIWRGDVLLDNV